MSPVCRENIKALESYTPGEQPGVDKNVIKLNTNENPYPVPGVFIQELKKEVNSCLRLYPDPVSTEPRSKLSSLLGIPLE